MKQNLLKSTFNLKSKGKNILVLFIFLFIYFNAQALSVCIGKQLTLTPQGVPNILNPWISSDPSIASITDNGVVFGVSLGSCDITFTDENSNITVFTISVEEPIYPTITLTSAVGTDNQSLNFNHQTGSNYFYDPLVPITYSISSGIAFFINPTSLPSGVTGSFSNGVFTISGTPYISSLLTTPAVFQYTIQAIDSNSCTCDGETPLDSIITVSGTITLGVPCQNYITGSSSTYACQGQTVVFSYNISGLEATGATFSGLPSYFTTTYSNGTLIASGVAQYPGAYFTVSTIGGNCIQHSGYGSFNVEFPYNPYLMQDSPNGTENQTVCVGTTIEEIQYSGYPQFMFSTSNGLPTGVNYNYIGQGISITGTPQEAGVFEYSVSATSLCYGTRSFTHSITVLDSPIVPIITASGTTSLCTGDSVILTSSATSGNIWSNGQTNQSIVVFLQGNYTVTNTNGTCSSTSTTTSVLVNQTPLAPIITVSGNTSFCSGDSVVLTSSSNSGNIWFPNGETSQSITVFDTGNYYTNFDSLGCSSQSQTTYIMVNENPIVNVGNITNPTTCDGNDGTIELVGSGFGNLTWNGTSSGSLNNVSLPLEVSNLTEGTYSFTLENGTCISNSVSSTLNDPIPPQTPIISAGGSTIFCSGEDVELISSSLTGNIWSNGETTQSIIVNSTGNYSVTVDINNCISSSSNIIPVTVNLSPNPVIIMATGSITFCEGDSVELIASSGANFSWSPTNESDSSIFATESGVYTVTVSSNGCSVTSNPVTVTSNPYPIVTISPFDDICNTANLFTLNQGSPQNGFYTVNGVLTNTFDPSSALLGINNIEYTYTSDFGCSSSISTTINVNNCLNLFEEKSTNRIEIYPNPTNGLITILSENLNKTHTFELRDEVGRIIESYSVQSNEMILDLSNLSNGVYMLVINVNSFEEIHKIQLVK